MITRERLDKSSYGRGLLDLFDRLVPYRVTDWGNDDSGTKDVNRPGARERACGLDDANVITSLHREKGYVVSDSFNVEEQDRHAVVLDIDHPAWLMPSTTPNHYHLYIDVPGGIAPDDWSDVLTVLARVGIIEPGYAGASMARGFTSCRLPWIEKEKGPKQHD